MQIPFRKKKKQFPVKVCSLDSQLEFNLDHSATGNELFEQVCRAFGLREEFYFGLQYEDIKGNICWLKKEKKVIDQNINKVDCVFMFYAKYFPENVQEELVQEITQHLFFLQIKQAILSMEYYCPPEASVLLASYYVQAKYGDYDELNDTVLLSMNEDLLPQRVIDQYSMTPIMWLERIKTWYADHKGMDQHEAEMEYLKIAQDLDMYGVNYFKITNKKNSELWLGITALGLNIYEKENKLQPRTVFQWSEIKNISFDDKKFTIKPIDKSGE
jgi:merlin